MYEDTPEDVAAERLLAGCFPGALGRPVLGRAASLRRMTGGACAASWPGTTRRPWVVAAPPAACGFGRGGAGAPLFGHASVHAGKAQCLRLPSVPDPPEKGNGAKPACPRLPGARDGQLRSDSPCNCSPASWAATPPPPSSRPCGKIRPVLFGLFLHRRLRGHRPFRNRRRHQPGDGGARARVIMDELHRFLDGGASEDEPPAPGSRSRPQSSWGLNPPARE